MQDYGYNLEQQIIFVETMLDDAEAFIKVNSITDPEYFDKALIKAVEFIQNHYKEFQAVPNFQQVNATTTETIAKPKEPINKDWFYKNYEDFIKQEAMKGAIFKSIDHLKKNQLGIICRLTDEANKIGLVKDLGINLLKNPEQTIKDFLEDNEKVKTGWKDLDFKLFGGFGRKELNVFVGGSGAGKSFTLQNLALNWIENGMSGAIVSLELSEGVIALRIYSMMTGLKMGDILKEAESASKSILELINEKSLGNLFIKQIPAHSTPNDVNAYITELKAKEKLPIDFIIVDHMDHVAPSGIKSGNKAERDDVMSQELRNIAVEENSIMVTASQFNREGIKEEKYKDHSHIAGGLSKINVCDNLIYINKTRAMVEKEQIQLELQKTRNSSGVGSKINLAQCQNTLRISDWLDGDSIEENKSTVDGTTVANQIRRGFKVPDDLTPAEKENRIKAMLAKGV